MKFHPIVLGLTALLGASGQAFAQGTEGAAAGEPDAAARTPEAGQTGQAVRRDWGERRRIMVVQRRLHAKDGRFELGLVGGTIPNDAFVSYGLLGVRGAYFVSESLAVEVAYLRPFHDADLGNWPNWDASDLGRRLKERFEGKIRSIQINDVLEHLAHVNLCWTPFFGKMTLLEDSVSSFDLGVSVGAGWANTTFWGRNEVTGVLDPQVQTRNTILGDVGLGFRFFLADWLVLRTDVNQFFFKKGQGGLSHPTMVSLGFSVLLPPSGR